MKESPNIPSRYYTAEKNYDPQLYDHKEYMNEKNKWTNVS